MLKPEKPRLKPLRKMISPRRPLVSPSSRKRRKQPKKPSDHPPEPSQDGDQEVSQRAEDGAGNGTDRTKEARGDQEADLTDTEEAVLTLKEEDATLARERMTTT